MTLKAQRWRAVGIIFGWQRATSLSIASIIRDQAADCWLGEGHLTRLLQQRVLFIAYCLSSIYLLTIYCRLSAFADSA